MTETSQIEEPLALQNELAVKSESCKTYFHVIQEKLNNILQAKKKIDANIAEIEYAIYNFEGSYLEETQNGRGNLIRGFGKYPKSALDKKDPKKFEIREEDRIFSRSSISYGQSVEMKKAQGPLLQTIPDIQGLTKITTAGEPMQRFLGYTSDDNMSKEAEQKTDLEDELIEPNERSNNPAEEATVSTKKNIFINQSLLQKKQPNRKKNTFKNIVSSKKGLQKILQVQKHYYHSKNLQNRYESGFQSFTC
ncbi:hypothetical protein G9A89_003235 [Geosiphon pyriformis]|nr:hypothetical protein G9A89_003235 [Geosiphon pyriformis]